MAASALPSWLLPVGLLAGVGALMFAARRPGPPAAALGSEIASRGRPAGDMRGAIQVGDVVHVQPEEIIPGLTPMPLWLVVGTVENVMPTTVRVNVTETGPNLAGRKPDARGPHDFSKDDVITILRDGVEIA